MQATEEMIKYAEAYMNLLNKGYTAEHLMSLPKIVKLPEEVMMHEILPHLSYQEVITVCSSSHDYYKVCEKYHVFKNLYYQYFKSIDFMNEPVNYLERMQFLQSLKELKKSLKSSLSLEKLYKKKDLSISKVNDITHIELLTNLKSLYLQNNNIPTLPKEIGNLTNLTDLVLQHNNLNELPKEIGNLTNLIELSLNYNNLTKLPKEIGNLINLDSFYFNNNKINKLPSEICQLQKLNSLQLENNNIKILPKCIDHLTNLKWLYIRKNPINTLPKSFKNLNVSNLYLDKGVVLPKMVNPNIHINYY